ncbi:MAG: DUF362 domain-containing protein [Candidatus Bathyarchaeota archaeon]|nr:DUF362 domain-containing protein [Candidatus Bathyarchaeota archaeon]MDH5686389.1 DUF362 domain-containing protein [Candidatus Bathyarchaeota archaeon]
MQEYDDVSVERCGLESSLEEVEKALERCLDRIGGISTFIEEGDTVAIKPNLVANPEDYPYAFHKGANCFATDRRVVFALVDLCRQVGAADIAVVETLEPSFGDKYAVYSYRDLAQKFEVSLIDLNIGPHKQLRIPKPYYLQSVRISEALFSYDKTINVPQLKVHASAGFSLGLKNLMGLTPATDRGPFHEKDPNLSNTLPYAIVDLNTVYKAQLTVIDGLLAADKTEHWGSIPVQMDLLLAGANVVATDTVGVSVMGFDPVTDFPNQPFLLSRSQLNLAKERGLGENRLEEIHVRGGRIEDVRKQFSVDVERRRSYRPGRRRTSQQ